MQFFLSLLVAGMLVALQSALGNAAPIVEERGLLKEAGEAALELIGHPVGGAYEKFPSSK